MEIDTIIKRLNGYDRHFKGRFLLLKDKILSDSEYIFWDLCYSVLADWDKDHGEKYGTFKYSLNEAGSLIGWDKTKVHRARKSLISKGFLEKLLNGRIRVSGYEIRENLTQLSKTQKLIDLKKYLSGLKYGFSNIEHVVLNPKPFSTKGFTGNRTQTVSEVKQANPKASLGSYKVNSVPLRSNEEYEELSKELNIPPQDLKDMDESIYETTGIRPK
jgi:hypothetical protein